MASHQTIVVEAGSSRIKVGFAGESKPRRVLSDESGMINRSGSWQVNVNDGMVSSACKWSSFFQYFSPLPSSSSPAASVTQPSKVTTVYEWEKTLYPLFSHVLTSILFIQRPSRHRMLLLINDTFPPINFREAIHKVLLEYLNVGGVWLVNGGVFEGLYHLLEGLPPKILSLGKPKAYLLVDIGTYEARVAVSVAGSTILVDTQQVTASGYTSFLSLVLTNYQEMNKNDDEMDEEGEQNSPATLEDANAIVRAWVALSSSSQVDFTTISVDLPSLEDRQQKEAATQELPIQPLLSAFHQSYLDYSNPSSLIYAMLTCIMTCPIDYRKSALQNVLLLGGGSVALRRFGSTTATNLEGRNSSKGLTLQLEMAARDACGISRDENNMEESKEEEKKDDSSSNISSIAKQRFQSLKGIVDGGVDESGERMGGINIQYPDPFGADVAAWVGGSIMGTLSYSENYQKKII